MPVLKSPSEFSKLFANITDELAAFFLATKSASAVQIGLNCSVD